MKRKMQLVKQKIKDIATFIVIYINDEEIYRFVRLGKRQLDLGQIKYSKKEDIMVL